MAVFQLKDMVGTGVKQYSPLSTSNFKAKTAAERRAEEEFERKKDFAEAQSDKLLSGRRGLESELKEFDDDDKFIADKQESTTDKLSKDKERLDRKESVYKKAVATKKVRDLFKKLQSYQAGPEVENEYDVAVAELKQLGGTLPKGYSPEELIKDFEDEVFNYSKSTEEAKKYDNYSSKGSRDEIATELASDEIVDADIASKKALADPFDTRGAKAKTKTQTDADINRVLKSSPEARAAHTKYTEGQSELAEAITNGTPQDKLAAQKKINEANNDFYNATGGLTLKVQSTSTLSNAEKAKADAAKSTQEVLDKEKDGKIKDRKEMSELIKYGDDRIDTFRKDKQKTLDAYDGAKKAKAMLGSIAIDRSPESLFATVKALALIMEPMSAVTDGEVNGFLGKTGAQDILNIGISLKEGISSLQNGANAEEIAYKMGNGNQKAVKKLQKLAETMFDNMTKMLSSIANMGAGDFVTYLEDDLLTAFGETVDPDKLKKLTSNFGKKLGTRLPAKGKANVKLDFKRATADNTLPPAKPTAANPATPKLETMVKNGVTYVKTSKGNWEKR